MLGDEFAKPRPQLKIWSLFAPGESEADDPVEVFAKHLEEAADTKKEVMDRYGQTVSLGQYNPNYTSIEQALAAHLRGKTIVPNEERRINVRVYSEMSARGVITPRDYWLMKTWQYLKAKAEDDVNHCTSERLWNKLWHKYMPKEIPTNESSIEVLCERQKAQKKKDINIALLCKFGLPSHVRFGVWSHFFRPFTQKYNIPVDKAKLYSDCLSKLALNDSAVFRQVEEDVESLGMDRGKAEVMRIAKAYCMWCFEGGKENFVYYRGVLCVIQKLRQVFDEVQTFWCIIHFALILPCLFKSQSVMTGSIFRNHMLLLMIISEIMEKEHPKIHRAIVRHGLPTECYIADKLLTLLTALFPTDTLLHLYDMVVLSADLTEPSKAVWVVVACCVKVFNLNEKFVLEAREAEQVLLILDNTGINHLNAQRYISELWKEGNELLRKYRGLWEVVESESICNSSANEDTREWSEKIIKLEDAYKEIKEFNEDFNKLIPSIRELLVNNPTAANDKKWIEKFVAYFCRHYGKYTKMEGIKSIRLYIDRCYNAICTSLEVKFGKQTYTAVAGSDGVVGKVFEFTPEAIATSIEISINGDGKMHCKLDPLNYRANMIITIDKYLYLTKGSGKSDSAQPFISLALSVTTKVRESVKDDYEVKDCNECIRRCMMREHSLLKQDENTKNMPASTGFRSISVPSARKALDEHENNSLDNIKALVYLFSLVRAADQDEDVPKIPIADETVRRVSDKIYEVFSSKKKSPFPIRRVLIMLIVTSKTTVDSKLSHLYTLYTHFAAVGEPSTFGALLLDDVIELVQLLCELHFIHFPPESLPSLVEYAMTGGRISRVVSCYLVTGKANVEKLVQSGKRGKVDRNVAVDVTEKVQQISVGYWKIRGHKQVGEGGSGLLWESLSGVLGEHKEYPKEPGPYSLVVCYKRGGEEYYKILKYDPMGLLAKHNTSSENKLGDLFESSCNSISFAGARIEMDKNEFIARMKKIPLLAERMQMQISIDSALEPKTRKNFKVKVRNAFCKIEVIFHSRIEEMQLDYDLKDPRKGKYAIAVPCAYNEDTLLEIQGRVVAAISKLEEKLSIVEYGLKAKQFDSFIFFKNETPLSPLTHLSSIVSIKVIVEKRCGNVKEKEGEHVKGRRKGLFIAHILIVIISHKLFLA